MKDPIAASRAVANNSAMTETVKIQKPYLPAISENVHSDLGLYDRRYPVSKPTIIPITANALNLIALALKSFVSFHHFSFSKCLYAKTPIGMK
jgi:hypothetical protein